MLHPILFQMSHVMLKIKGHKGTVGDMWGDIQHSLNKFELTEDFGIFNSSDLSA